MKLTHLKLNNFQKHENLELDFSPNVNVIYGKSDSGKSTIIRAIRWLLVPSELRGDVVRKEGSKKTSVIGTFDNGAIIERIKTASTNSYKLTINSETKEYNSTGNNLPIEISEIIKVSPIEIDQDAIILNIANQLSMPFLLEKSGSFRHKLFNKITGNELIDKVFQDLNKDILSIGREEKSEKEYIENLNSQFLTINQQKEKLSKLLDDFKPILEQLKLKQVKVDKLTNLLTNYISIQEKLLDCKQEIKCVKLISKSTLASLEEKITKYDKLKSLFDTNNKVNSNLLSCNNKLKNLILIPKEEIKELENKIKILDKLQDLCYTYSKVSKSLRSVTKDLNELKLPKINLGELEKKIKLLANLKEWNHKLNQIKVVNLNHTNKLNKLAVALSKLNDRYKELLKSIKICPFYNQVCPLNKGDKDETC